MTAANRDRLLLAGVWVASVLYAGSFLSKGWVPHDEGLIAQSAVRILEGEKPYRDFDGGYTGALNHLHAGAFRLFGVDLLASRYALWIFFAAFVPAVFRLARRIASPWGAALLTALATAWSVPNYFASLPSWYNLFFAAWGALALIKFVETNRGVWLVTAGACGGMSVLFKITGAYYIAAAILFLLYEETSSAVPESARTVRWPLALRIVATGALLAAVTSTIRARLAPMETLHFLVPTVVLCLLVVRKELLSPMPAGRWSRHVRRLGLLALGILVPIAAYGIFIGLTEISAMLASLRHSISRQLSTPKASRYLPALRDVWPALPYMSLLGFGPYVRANRTVTRALFVAAGLLALAPILLGPAAYKVEWLSARSLAPAVVLVGGALLWRTARDVPREREVEVFLFLALAGMVSLVQVPFSAPIYFCYVAPLVALAAAAVAGGWSRPLAVLHAGVGLFYLVFAVYRMNPGYLFQLGERPQAYVADARLTMPRGQLIVPKAEADLYNALVAAIRTRSRGNDLWAGPDCPEIYFLAERRNPERWFYGFQNPLYRDDAALLRRLDEPRFRVLVIQHHPGFSARYSPGLREEMARRFPGSAEFGGFTLRWRDGF